MANEQKLRRAKRLEVDEIHDSQIHERTWHMRRSAVLRPYFNMLSTLFRLQYEPMLSQPFDHTNSESASCNSLPRALGNPNAKYEKKSHESSSRKIREVTRKPTALNINTEVHIFLKWVRNSLHISQRTTTRAKSLDLMHIKYTIVEQR